MNKQLSSTLACLLAIITFSTTPLMAEDHGEQEHEHGTHEGEHEEEGGIHLTPEQLKMGGIEVTTLAYSQVPNEVEAPGEIRLNAYATSKVAPRIAAQVITRQARLGDHVEKGQPLVTLSSVAMAAAQGDLLVAEREWRRVKKLGREVVSEQRYTNARIAREQARAKVLAYGMTRSELTRLLGSGDAARAEGRFQLQAGQNGTVIEDAFVVGELVEPGRELFTISDESRLWVEARLSPEQAANIKPDTPAIVIFQTQRIPARVTQVHHALDESTRTLGVRLEIPNPDDRLHPGLFVKTLIQGDTSTKALALPSEAILRSPDGDWQVFIEHQPGEFEPQEVDVVRNSGNLTMIEGLEPGARVVTKGAFFLQSELAKSGFEVHNH